MNTKKGSLAWSIIGLFHLIAIALVSVIVLHAAGVDLTVTWKWIVAGAGAILLLMIGMVWVIFRAEET